MSKKNNANENKNWFRRHWLLTIIGIIFILAIIGSLSDDDKTNENTIGLWDKDTNYTLNECYQICEEAMPTAIQETVCVSSCDNIGKEGEILDKMVNMYKKNYLEREK